MVVSCSTENGNRQIHDQYSIKPYTDVTTEWLQEPLQ